MGLSLDKISSYCSKHVETRVLITGLDAAGKTTLLYMLKLGEVVTTIPTIGWDAGGRTKIRPSWLQELANMSAIIFVVDSNDRERINEACQELHQLTNEKGFQTLPILIFANKQDLPNGMSLDEMKEKLNLSKLDETKTKWHLQPSTATKNEGINEGFLWLANTLKPKTDYTQPIVETINDSKIMKNDLLSLWNSTDLKTMLSKFG